jgi:predicted  nucleic acid-binding Zn-ribbon protein
MNPTVEALLVLQARDIRVAELTDELEDIPRQVAAAERELAARTLKFGELKNTTRLIESERKKIDLEVKSKEAAIVRYKAQQLTTRKNEEFAALNHEIEHAQVEISKLEDSELELMESYEKGLLDVAAGEKELAQFDAKAKQKKADLQKRGEVLAADLKATREKQAVAEQAVPEEAVSRYRRILKSKGDVAIVPIHGGACGGCHMKLTTQTVVSARGSEGLTSCENCARLVYAED